MNIWGGVDYTRTLQYINDTLSIPNNKCIDNKSVLGLNKLYRKIIANYILNRTLLECDIEIIYENYKSIYSKSDVIEHEADAFDLGKDGLDMSIILNLYGSKERKNKLLSESTSFLLGIRKGKEDIPPQYNYSYSSGEHVKQQLHALLISRNFYDFYAQTSNDYLAFIGGYTPVMKWRKSSYMDLIYSAKCIEKEWNRVAGASDKSSDYWIDLYHALYLYNIEKNNKNDYAQIALNNMQMIIQSENIDIIEDGAKIIDLCLEYPEVFDGILEAPIEIKKVKTGLTDFSKLRLLSPLDEYEEKLIKDLKKKSELNWGIDLKLSNTKKVKEFIENLIITLHNAKDVEREFISKFNEDSLVFLQSKFNRYSKNLYEQAICYRLLNMMDESNKCVEKLRVLIQENEEILVEEYKPLWLGYSYFYLALLEKTRLWGEENNNKDLLNDYLFKAKYYLAADKKSETLLKNEFSEPVQFDELPDSFICNAMAHLLTNDLEKFKGTIYTSGISLDDWDFVRGMEIEGMVIGDVTIKHLIKSSEELIQIREIRYERMEIQKDKLTLVKKLNYYVTSKEKEKACLALDKVKAKIYNGIKSVEDAVELIPVILSI